MQRAIGCLRGSCVASRQPTAKATPHNGDNHFDGLDQDAAGTHVPRVDVARTDTPENAGGGQSMSAAARDGRDPFRAAATPKGLTVRARARGACRRNNSTPRIILVHAGVL